MLGGGHGASAYRPAPTAAEQHGKALEIMFKVGTVSTTRDHSCRPTACDRTFPRTPLQDFSKRQGHQAGQVMSGGGSNGVVPREGDTGLHPDVSPPSEPGHALWPACDAGVRVGLAEGSDHAAAARSLGKTTTSGPRGTCTSRLSVSLGPMPPGGRASVPRAHQAPSCSTCRPCPKFITALRVSTPVGYQ